jgi:N-acetylmuramoyl-L-alanine amidase
MRVSLFPRAVLAAALLFAGIAPSWAFHTVVIDPGHGGHDNGGIPGQKIPEKTMALDTGLRLRAILLADGYGVKMTRSDDTFIPLDDRCAISNATPDAIFVSIHFDAYRASHADGITVIYYANGNGRSRSLANAVHREMLGHLHPNTDRGVTSRVLAVLHHNRWPAILVEGGYLTSPVEAAKIIKPAYRQELAQAIADGIEEFGH